MNRFVLIFSVVMLLPFSSLLAQNVGITTFNKRPEKKKRQPPITQEFGFGLRLNSDGWSVSAQRGFINNYENRTSFIWVDFSEKKHPKEDKQLNQNFAVTNPALPAPLPFKYAKINNFYQFKFGYGQKRALTGKLDKKNVTISWLYGVGASIGFLKPYYLQLSIPQSGGGSIAEYASYYDEDFKEYFLRNDGSTIIGGAFFTRGIGELSIKPGLAARSGFYFDYTPTKTSFLGVEIGASLEVYPNTIPIMAETKNKGTFLNLYLDVCYGKRWSKDY